MFSIRLYTFVLDTLLNIPYQVQVFQIKIRDICANTIRCLSDKNMFISNKCPKSLLLLLLVGVNVVEVSVDVFIKHVCEMFKLRH